MIQQDELTRHAVCLGMTGSGKTGLCVGLLEDVALAGVPILAVDPKGDLANLALVFPELTQEAFAPWTSEPERLARLWSDNVPPGATAAFVERVAVRVLTPGSESGVPVDVLSMLTTAPRHLAGDPEGSRELVTGAVAALLGLVGRPSDPLRDPAAILLTRLLGDAFARGEDLPLDRLIPAVVDPPFSQLGVLALDTFMPRDERMALAGDLNAVIASPAFAPWRKGVPLDVGAWLTPGPRTPITVLYLAHLDEAQRLFFLTLLLHQVVSWSRRLPGTPTLRALVYLDEVMGMLPPHPKNPSTKWPILTLMKQARAVGVGVMLCTQNPVDLDYKAMSNAGTWLVGRLQTRQDRARVLDGLATAGVQVGDLDDALTELPPRHFVVRDGGPPRTVRSRHTLAFLRGPLTRAEVSRLGGWAGGGGGAAEDGLLAVAPPCPDGLPARWLDPAVAVSGLAGAGDGVWRPALVLRWAVRFRAPGWVHDATVTQVVFPAEEEGAPVVIELPDEAVLRVRPAGGRYAPVPGWLFGRGAVNRWRERMRDGVARGCTVEGPEGVVVAERGDVRVVVGAVVWVG